MGRTPRRKSRNRTYRRPFRGGDVANVKKILADTAITDQNLTVINPASKFVVATYWWGQDNVNRNLQKPCPEEITSEAKKVVLKNHISEFPKALTGIAGILKAIEATNALPLSKKKLLECAREGWKTWQDTLLAKPENKAELAAEQKKLLDAERAKMTAEATSMVDALSTTVEKQGRFGVLQRTKIGPEAQATQTEASQLRDRAKDRKFPEMIEEWKSYCERAKVNYLALQTEFPRTDYQHGINAKPLFILKLLDYLREKEPTNPKGVLYIDGDMWVHKYPTLFDIEDVDFMARGWNIDPRGKSGSLTKPFFDPMIFETSGGTMYFGNTEGARRLLIKWSESAEAQPGKADDRVLSQIFTTKSLVLETNIINLPIEYLWLTDMYQEFLTKEKNAPLTIENAIIEHPYCLTGEERATDQGAATSRAPEGYDEEITDAINYKRSSQLIYEYIMCNGNPAIQQELSGYLNYIGKTEGAFSKVPLATVIAFDKRYGDTINAIADKNLAGLPAQAPPTGTTVSVASGSIPEILKALRAGNNVWTDPAAVNSILPYRDVDCYAVDAAGKEDGADWYTRFVQVDTTKPMFFAAKSPVLQHLLIMCDTLADMNTHLKNSYLFLSRIRWAFVEKES